jgi:hypothetical protein
METKNEFIQNFKQQIIDGVRRNMPKDYRNSRTYAEQSFETKFNQAINHSSFDWVLEEVLEQYYNQLSEYENILGY